jgi:hypothetical protein
VVGHTLAHYHITVLYGSLIKSSGEGGESGVNWLVVTETLDWIRSACFRQPSARPRRTKV